MTVCIDTNVLLPTLSAVHSYRAIREAWMRGEFAWAVSTEILLEYEELATARLGPVRWMEFMQLLDVVEELFGNVLHVTPRFRFRLIHADPDDNKFVDCAIAANADFILTDDRHFDLLKSSGYKPQPITPEEFLRKVLDVAT